jgi:hypothetical protein
MPPLLPTTMILAETDPTCEEPLPVRRKRIVVNGEVFHNDGNTMQSRAYPALSQFDDDSGTQQSHRPFAIDDRPTEFFR